MPLSLLRNYRKLSLAGLTGLGMLTIACVLLLFNWRLSLLCVCCYGLVCMAAPLFPRWGFFLSVISRGCSGKRAVALTFDDGPDPLATPALLHLLKSRNVPATFFVSGKRATKYPNIIKTIIDDGHTIGNHSFRHNPLDFFRSIDMIKQDISATQSLLGTMGIVPFVYRPPIGIVSPKLKQPLNELNLILVNFSIRAFDGGNKRIGGIAAKILKRIRADDIIMLHDIMPKGIAYRQPWLQEMETLLDGLQNNRLAILPLEELIDRPVMGRITVPRNNERECALGVKSV